MRIRHVLLKLWRRRRLERDLESELAFHRDMARQHANPIPLGNVGRIHDEALDVWRFTLIEDFWRDLTYAVRSLGRAPGFAAIAILTLALGIGANTAIFTLIDHVMLESLPVEKPRQLVELLTDRGNGPGGAFSYQALQVFRDHTQLCSSIIGVFDSVFHILIEGQTLERLNGQFVTGNYFSTLGIGVLRGRPLGSEDDSAGSGKAVAVVSYSLWQDRLGGNPDAIGKTLIIENVPFTVIGVAPAGFHGLEVGRRIDVWVPLEAEARLHHPSWTSSVAFKWLRLVGRLKPGATLEKAEAELRVLFANVVIEQEILAQQENPRFGPFEEKRIRSWSFLLQPASAGLSAIRREYAKPLLVLMVIVGLLLLIACTNVANLLFARAVTRQKEIALRLSLGAGRTRLIGQLLTEGGVLAIAGAVFGLVAAHFVTKWLVVFLSKATPPLVLDVPTNMTVLGFATGIAIVTVLLFGLMPAFRSTSVDFASALRGTAGGWRPLKGNRWSGGLIVVQVSVLMVLILSAGLFLRTLYNLNSTDLGFNRNNVLLVALDSFGSGHSSDQLKSLIAQLRERIERLPGVKSAGLSMFPPISGGTGINLDFVLNPDGGASAIARGVFVNIVSSQYFATLGTPIIAGRDFPAQPSKGTRAVIVNQTFARRYFGDTSPIGKAIVQRNTAMEIVGLVGDAKYEEVREAMQPTVYFDAFQEGSLRPDGPVPSQFLIRTEVDPATLAGPIRSEVQLAIGNVVIRQRTLEDHIGASLVRERLVTTLASLFGCLALVLAGIGLYGVVSHSVTMRRKEIGIRIALGFSERGVVYMVLREVFVLVVAGIALGLPLALVITRSTAGLLYGLTPNDPLTIVASVSALLISAFAAGFIPARKASRVDPMVVLRVDQ